MATEVGCFLRNNCAGRGVLTWRKRIAAAQQQTLALRWGGPWSALRRQDACATMLAAAPCRVRLSGCGRTALASTIFSGKLTDGMATPRIESSPSSTHPLYCRAIRWHPLPVSVAAACRSEGRDQ